MPGLTCSTMAAKLKEGVGVDGAAGGAVGSEVGVGVDVGIGVIVALKRASSVASMSGVEVGAGVGKAACTAADTVAPMSGVGVATVVTQPTATITLMSNKTGTRKGIGLLAFLYMAGKYHRLLNRR